MSVAEPATLLTDYALAAFTAYCGWRLLREHAGQRSRVLWSAALLALAVAAAAGGTHHGFSPQMSEAAARGLWTLTVMAIGVFSFGAVAGSTVAETRGALRTALLIIATSQLLIYGGWMLAHDEYRYVVLDTAAAMAALLLLHGWAAVSRRERSSYWILGGVAVSALAAAVQFYRLAPHPHFNHNDLYHVIQIAAMALFYRGVGQLRDRSGARGSPDGR